MRQNDYQIDRTAALMNQINRKVSWARQIKQINWIIKRDILDKYGDEIGKFNRKAGQFNSIDEYILIDRYYNYEY